MTSETLPSSAAASSQLVDGFGRRITYVRLSVTDRCDLRCRYCMAEDMTFLPRHEVLSIEELARLGTVFTELGVSKIRVTGGEPLIRRGIVDLMDSLGQLPGLNDLCMTTNATHMAQYAQALKDAGVKRINISLDSLNPERFRYLTRHGDLAQVLEGIRAAQQAGFERIKLNCVALKNYNADEAPELVRFALNEGLDISFIEEMPLGQITDHGRAAEFVSSAELRESIEQKVTLRATTHDSGGPARYWQVPGYDSRIGFISPHSQNFCASCNRVRVTATGRLLLCLGQENSVDLRAPLRESSGTEQVRQVIVNAMAQKPKEHDFTHQQDEPQILRFMNVSGG
ncbi:GTP 3',8-cyclase MoaA [Marinimicrobium sp. ABcell2]|uniref:GTP 3',8-cyclase MoaA n=1 Tax=Marinimicrobium sp. ABcell2 TaxID=3069751 RepID=UPI0027B3FD9E|nr:GTP 3',8-cyclase MoaA [Marinimicrobium sp. ABcell2]MDQ2076065.1 GTP 3',8-cyclase MoaA [Marinimicrobium sp. ABcell2]